MDHLSTHVLDVARGCPAEGIAVTLERADAVVFYPEVIVRVRITDSGGRFHLPLLLSPFGYSTYRGS